MSQYDKLVQRLKSLPSDFAYLEAKKLLNHLGYIENSKGMSSGSRVQFFNPENGHKIDMHKPHPSGILKVYQVKQLKDKLEEWGEI